MHVPKKCAEKLIRTFTGVHKIEKPAIVMTGS